MMFRGAVSGNEQVTARSMVCLPKSTPQTLIQIHDDLPRTPRSNALANADVLKVIMPAVIALYMSWKSATKSIKLISFRKVTHAPSPTIRQAGSLTIYLPQQVRSSTVGSPKCLKRQVIQFCAQQASLLCGLESGTPCMQ